METVPMYVSRGSAVEPVCGSDVIGLTERETAVLQLVCEAMPDKVIARKLGICVKTVGGYLESIYRKLGVGHDQTNARCAAILKAVQLGLVVIDRPH